MTNKARTRSRIKRKQDITLNFFVEKYKNSQVSNKSITRQSRKIYVSHTQQHQGYVLIENINTKI